MKNGTLTLAKMRKLYKDAEEYRIGDDAGELKIYRDRNFLNSVLLRIKKIFTKDANKTGSLHVKN